MTRRVLVGGTVLTLFGVVVAVALAAGGVKITPDSSSPGYAAYAKYQGLSVDTKLTTNLPCTGAGVNNETAGQATAYKPPKAKRRYTIGMMEPTLAGHYYQAGSKGGAAAAKAAGVSFQLVSAGTGYASPEQQLSQADQLIAKKVDAVVVIPTDIQGGVAVTNRFLQHNIPVVIVATEAGTPKAYMIMQDDYGMGVQSADELVKQVGKNAGPGVIIGGPANATWSRKRVEGFTARVKAKYPGVQIVASPTQNVDPSLGLQSFQNATAAHPNIKWVYTVFNLLLSPQSMPAKYKGIAFITNGLDPVSIADLKAGRVSEVIGITPTPMGYQGVGEAVAILNGDQKVPALTCIPITKYTNAAQGASAQSRKLELIPGEKP
jgi:ABC-type sugar transport system substrate-binding protein